MCRWSTCRCEISTASRSWWSAGSRRLPTRRRISRRSKTSGSVRMRVPAISMSIVACPRNVSEGSGRGGSIVMPMRTVPERDLVYDRPVTGSSGLDRVVALVPVRGLEGAKARLGEALDAEERRALVERLLARTIEAAAETAGVAVVGVVSRDAATLELAERHGAVGVAQVAGGLNEGLEAGARGPRPPARTPSSSSRATCRPSSAAELGRVVRAADALLVQPAAEGPAPGAVVVIVPDRAGTGTNLLLVAPPGVIAFALRRGLARGPCGGRTPRRRRICRAGRAAAARPRHARRPPGGGGRRARRHPRGAAVSGGGARPEAAAGPGGGAAARRADPTRRAPARPAARLAARGWARRRPRRAPRRRPRRDAGRAAAARATTSSS